MKKLLVLFISALIGFQAAAQGKSTIVEIISGKVINEITNEPVAYTNVGLENTLIGTASNAEGYFELKIPKDMVDKSVYFSAVGFKNDTFPVSQLFGREYSIVKLEPRTYDIENIDIAGRSRVMQRILRMASENTPYNFIGGPFNLIGTYTNNKTIDDTIHTEKQLGVLIYDETGYSDPSVLNAYKQRSYSLENKVANKDLSFAEGSTNLDDLLEFDLVRTASSVLDPDILGRFELALKDEPQVDGKPAWVISFSEPNPSLAGSRDFYANLYEGEITIIKDDYSVKKITGKVKSARNNRQGKSLAVSPSAKDFHTGVSYDFTIVYSNLKPDYIIMDRSYKTNGKKVNEKTSLVVKQVQTTNLTTISGREYFVGK